MTSPPTATDVDDPTEADQPETTAATSPEVHDTGGARAEGSGRNPRLAGYIIPLTIIVLAVALVGWVIRASFYQADDWIMFQVSKVNGWSWRTLGFNLYYHFAPIPWALHLVVQEVAPVNYAFGWTIIVVLAAGILLSLWWVLRQLAAPLAVVALALGVTGTSVALARPSAIFDESAFVFPVVICMFLCTGFFIRWCHTERTFDLVATVVTFAVALLDQEMPLLLVPGFLVIRYVVVPKDATTRIHRALWRDKFVWLPFLVIGGVYTWFFRTHYYGKFPGPSVVTVLRYYALGVIGLGRTLLGSPTSPIVGTARWLTLVIVIGAIAWVVAAAARSPYVRRALLYFVVVFALKVGALAFGVGGIRTATSAMGDPQYFPDLCGQAFIAAGLATSPWIRARWISWSSDATSRVARRHRVLTRRATWTALAAVVAICLVHAIAAPFGMSQVEAETAPAHAAQKYTANVENALTRVDRERSHATIIPLVLPYYVSPGFIAPYNDQSAWLDLLPQWRDQQTGPVDFLSNAGTLHPALAGSSASAPLTSPDVVTSDLVPAASSSGASCYTTGHAPGSIRFFLAQPVTGPTPVADIDLTVRRLPSSKSHEWLITGVTPAGHALDAAAVNVHLGQQRLMAWLGGDAIASVIVSPITPDSTVCISGVQVGTLVATDGTGRTCHPVSFQGALLATRVDCGMRWS